MARFLQTTFSIRCDFGNAQIYTDSKKNKFSIENCLSMSTTVNDTQTIVRM